MFVDASALTSMVLGEADSIELAARLQHADVRMTSPLSVWEAATAVSRVLTVSPSSAGEIILAYLRDVNIDLVEIPTEVTSTAISAFERYGKGRHKAKLNFGDCFSYACAKHFRQPLMFKGDDFALTDVDVA
ncbi:MAG TPA: type II toxin-antitoxin system VapC family toxin [Rhizobiaceae bacterium]|nr:type II toxin-antitoxin system VapC family toxin [Rhizobiaceae bacterium]